MISIEQKNSKTNLLLSVCMITYNHEGFIEKAIEGILMQQTNFDIELILANDASTDKTNELIENHILTHPRKNIITYINRIDNIGMIPNFMDVITMSNSRYIAICEGDDYWTDPLKLQKQVDFLESRLDIDVCFTRSELLTENKFKLQSILPEYVERQFTYRDLLKHYNFVTMASVVFRNPNNLRFPSWFNNLPYGDMGLYKLLSNSNNFYCLTDVTSVYRVHEGGAYSGIDKLSSRKNYYTFYKLIYPYLNTKEREVSKVQMRLLRKEIAQLRFPNALLYRMLYYFYLELKRLIIN